MRISVLPKCRLIRYFLYTLCWTLVFLFFITNPLYTGLFYATQTNVKETIREKTDQTMVTEPSPKTFDGEVHRLSVKYHQNELLVREIIYCESRGVPSARNLQAVVGVDIGYWQINTFYHLASAKAVGLDIYNQWDNLEYGFILLSNQGTRPWNWSKPCWSK